MSRDISFSFATLKYKSKVIFKFLNMLFILLTSLELLTTHLPFCFACYLPIGRLGLGMLIGLSSLTSTLACASDDWLWVVSDVLVHSEPPYMIPKFFYITPFSYVWVEVDRFWDQNSFQV